MFTPDICVPALRAINPTTKWVAPDVLGIDAGITLLSAENLRSGAVWRWFMGDPEIPKAMDAIGLLPESPPA